MCEILFRGKRLDNGKWAYGYLFVNEINGETVILDSWKSPVETDVDHSTVGRCTGLTDKNGVKIFEGDIIRRTWLGRLRIYQVCYDWGTAAFIGECVNGGGFTTFHSDGDMFEVIGNIHDNPKLMKS